MSIKKSIERKVRNSRFAPKTLIAKRIPLWRKLAVFILLICVFSTSVLAAPESTRTVVSMANQIGQEARFKYLSSNFGTAFNGWANKLLLFFSTNQGMSQVSRIEITPRGDLAIRQGEPISFTAIGYTTDGIPVNGLKFQWMIEDVEGNRGPRPLQNGVFQASMKGRFVIKVRTGGFVAQSNIVVEENIPLMIMKRIKADEERGNLDVVNRLIQLNRYRREAISSKKNYTSPARTDESTPQEPADPGSVAMARPRGPNAQTVQNDTATYGTKSSMAMMRPADDDGWSNSNWWLADDPGNQTGNPTGTSPDAGVGSGNFQLSAPVVSLPGRGMDVSLALNYNSRVWSKSGNVMSFDAERGFPAPGWNLGFGKMMFMGSNGGCMLIGSDGTKIGYTGTISNYSFGGDSTTYFDGHTTDGNLIDYSCSVSTSNGVTTMSASSKLSNGITVQYYANSLNGKQAFPTRIADAQGNYVDVAYRNNRGPEIQTVTDTLGRVVTFNYDSNDRLISVDVPKMNNAGTRTAVRIHYRQLTLNPGWSGSITTDTNNATPYVVDAIYYPGTNKGYWFGADPNASDYATYYSSYGMLANVVEQRGMSWAGTAGDQGTVSAGTTTKQATYNYPLSPNYTLTDAPTFATLTENWAGMDTAPVVTSYNIAMSSSPRVITVTHPNGLKSKQYMYNASGLWNDGLIYQDESLDSANTQLSKSAVTWGQGSYDSPRPTVTEVTDEKGQVLKTTYTYGANYNQVTSKKEFDYNGTTLVKETRTTQENNVAYTGRHIFNLVRTAEVYDGNGSRVSKTDYEYDNDAVVNGTSNPNLKAASGVTMHYGSYDPFTTDTHQENGSCLLSQFNYSQCTYEGEEIWVPTAGGYYDYCWSECLEYEQNTVSDYDSGTVYRGNLTKTTVYSAAANETGVISQTKQYDVTGNLVAESASCCELKTYEYTVATQFAYPTTQTRGSSDPNSSLRNTSTALFDFNTGLIKQATDPNGNTNYAAYDPDTLRPTVSTSSTGSYSQTSYADSTVNSYTNVVTEEVKDANGVLAGKTVKYLNGIGKVSKEESYGPNNIVDIVETKFTQDAEEWQQSRPYRSGDTIQWSEKFYDLQGRLFKTTEADGSESKVFHNEAAYPDSATLISGYLPPGNTIRVMDAWGRDRWVRYDYAGKIAEVVEPNPNGNGSVLATGNLVTKYTHDTLGRLIKTEQGAQIREFNYDSLGRMTRQKLAEQIATLNDSGTFVGENQSGAKWSEASTFDNRSNLISKTDARGVKSVFAYQISGADDPLNRIQSRSYDLSGPLQPGLTINYAPPVTYEYMTTGDKSRIKKIRTDGILTEDFAYDGEGRVNESKQTVDNRGNYPMTVNYLYDSLDRLKEVTYPAQYGISGNPRKIVAHSYDTSSRLTGLTVDAQQQASNMVYDASDQTTSIKIGSAGTNQVTENYTFDPQTGLLTNQNAVRNGTSLLDLSYDYNRNSSVGNLNGKTGNLTKITNNLDTNKNREYEFDAIGRLTKAKGGTNSLWTQSYSYDRYGNRTAVAATGVAADNSTMPADGIAVLAHSNNRITTTGFEYDVSGNQTKGFTELGAAVKYEYDAANRLQVIRLDDTNQTLVQAYQFGSTNARLIDYAPSVGLNKFYGSFGGTTLSEYTEYGQNIFTWTKSRVYLGDRLLSTTTPNGGGGEYTEFDHPDRLGTRVITNQAGGLSEQVTLPFGTSLSAETTTGASNQFTSYERNIPTGLDYAVNRTYDSKQGRFTQIDPIGMNAVDLNLPQTLNLYSYCGNDPINRTDPDGLSWFSKLFRIFRTIFNIIVNIIRIAVTVAIIVALFTTPVGWGTVWLIGALIFAAIVPNLISIVKTTIYRSIKESVRENGLSFGSFFRGLWRGIKRAFSYLASIFTRSLVDYFGLVYGYFCGPGYGSDGPTRDQPPVDELDSACRQHDLDMQEVKDMQAAGLISKKEAKRLKTKYDLRFMLRAIASGNQASGGYLLMLQVIFFVRIILR